MPKNKLQILMFFAMIAWGSTWVSAKVLMQAMNAYELIFWRFFISAIGLLIPIILFKINLKVNLFEIFLAFISATFLIAYNYFFFLGTHFGNAGFGAVLVTTLNPILTFALVSALTMKALKAEEVLALIIGAIGVLVILEIWQYGINVLSQKGVIFFLLAAATWPIITVISSKYKGESPLSFSFYVFVFTSIGTYVLFLNNSSIVLNLDIKGWINLLALSLYGTTFGTSVYFIATAKWGSKKAAAYFFLVPFSAVVFASVFLGEAMGIFAIIGGATAIVAVYQLNGYKVLQRFNIWKIKKVFWR